MSPIFRRSRISEGVQLRKSKREEQLSKRRNITDHDVLLSDDDATHQGTSGDNGGNHRSQQLLAILAGFGSTDPAVVVEAVTAIRKLLSRGLHTCPVHATLKNDQANQTSSLPEENPPIDEVISAGLVPTLVAFLTAEGASDELRFEAAWALTNVASGNSAQTQAVVDAGAPAVFVRLLQPDSRVDDKVRDQAIWAIGNIAGDSPANRDALAAMGATVGICGVLDNCSSISITRNASWALANLFRCKDPPPSLQSVQDGLATMGRLLYHGDDAVMLDAAWAFSYLADGSPERVQLLVDSGHLPRFVSLLMHTNTSIASAALRTLGNVVTGNDSQTQAVLDASVLPVIAHIIQNPPRESMLKEASWLLSNITAGSRTQIQAVLTAGLLQPLIDVLGKAEFKTRKEAAWALANVCQGGTKTQIRTLVEAGVIPPLCDLLTVTDTALVNVCLTALEIILRLGATDVAESTAGERPNLFALQMEECGGLDKVEFLQSHEDVGIYVKAYEIVEQYFCDTTAVEDLNDNLVPAPSQVPCTVSPIAPRRTNESKPRIGYRAKSTMSNDFIRSIL